LQANVLIDEKRRPILCDCSLAFIVVGSEFTSVKTAGTCRWAAPEVMNPPDPARPGEFPQGSDNDVYFSLKGDVYSFGMTILEVYSGEPPFRSIRLDSVVVFKVINGNRPQLPSSLETHPKLGALVKKCWSQDPENRPIMADVCRELESGILLLPAAKRSLTTRLWQRFSGRFS